MFSRRELIKAGVVSTVALSLPIGFAQASSAKANTGITFHTLTEADRSLLLAMVPAILAGALPEDKAEAEQASMEVVVGMDMAIVLLPALTQAELRQFFDLLENQLLPDWSDPTVVSGFIAQTQSNGDLPAEAQALQIGMNSLIGLMQSAWYGNPRSWSLTHYAGPPQLY